MNHADQGTDVATLLSRARLLIFDFDGTLADTANLHRKAFEEVLAPYAIPFDYAAIAGMKTADALATIFGGARVSLDREEHVRLAAEKQERVRRAIAEGLDPLPGVEKFLASVRDGYRLAICSAGSRTTLELSLSRLGFKGLFDPFVCADDVAAAKPDPEGLLEVLKRACVDAEDAIVFEDSGAGVEAARRAEIACLRVDPVGGAGQWDAWRRHLISAGSTFRGTQA